MEQLAPEIWIFNGEPVWFLGLPFSTRMTVVRLPNNDLWIHSPIKLSPDRKAQIDGLGCVKYLIAPNHLHHLFLSEWITAYPDATCFGTNEVIKKRDDIAFDASLNQLQSWPWSTDIEQELFSGSSLMEECVFFHKGSNTLIVADLVENFSGHNFNCVQRFIAKGVGIMAPNGKMPLDWRLSFMFRKAEARQHLARVLAWEPQILVMAHGEIIKENTRDC
ncbi:DUF4336 domain-containing protein [Celerinatantimonas diazotrophica]|uniref:Uncharacterized protein DUF4336 n=1 Tax=Celerinatantimonas diazotrophica TaxID=412034 RepID=A0A4R1JLG1_9GAMM|nr:DUF4336 domain-containing protein [Celerinatantimonas diazotrophica]TCK51827.1 uncharacterized protein DUF4336 [Celerinatantimonas diazotrophica]CAG9296481.1 hypothetical protein CEDIAZO_01632 [Celerinatantimonas diazotrophica]